jgi:carnitine O-acetyltransferase
VHPSNKAALEQIESSIFTLCLDDTSPVTRNEVGRGLWHGDGRNRFFDKSVQIIVFANGKAGMNGEASAPPSAVDQSAEMPRRCSTR